jgi:hypothetical protein
MSGPTPSTNVRFSGHPGVPLVRRLERHGLCRCCDRHGERHDEKSHHAFLLAKRCQKQLMQYARGAGDFNASATS